MAQLTVRNFPTELVRALRVRAAKHGRSAEAEHRLILERALRVDADDFWAEADALRAETKGRRQTGSEQLLRKMRLPLMQTGPELPPEPAPIPSKSPPPPGAP